MKIFFVILICFILTSTTVLCQVRMTSSFEGSLLANIDFYEGCCAWSSIKSSHRAFTGSYSARLEQRRDDPEVGTGSNRVEFNVNSTNTLPNRYDWEWFKISIYIPSDSSESDPGINYIMGQVKQPGTGGVQTGSSPPLAFVVDGDNVSVWIRWATAANPHSDNNSNRRIYSIGSRGVDQWVHYVVQYQRSHLSTGKVRVWRNDILVVDDSGPNYFEDAAFPSMKFGFYSYRWASVGDQGSTVDYRVMYMDDIGVYGSSSTYDDVATYRIPPSPETPTIQLKGKFLISSH